MAGNSPATVAMAPVSSVTRYRDDDGEMAWNARPAR